jgi:hypothetical protein
MISIEEIDKFLPKYLSPETEEQLFSELKQFPYNIDKRFYSYELRKHNILYQGDGIKEILIINLPDKTEGYVPSIILSNTCDINPENKRLFPSRIVYAPVFNLGKYKNKLLEKGIKTHENIDQHIESIRKQRVTQIFYLPVGDELKQESIVFLDRIYNLPSYALGDDFTNRKLFTLSQYGHYIFLLKISIHFTRITEKIERPID